ncbi:TrmH family RNA methyltransferase [Aquabacterium parvum]|uniref:TrmH family RNA methyltransferase n=1 Tax=Aquabacterium parvum TaxID=70584 RepID=UPI00071905AC|nr:RNA methyltransferase [Aquabacterium parvum]MBU0918090.1 RNA methyltransferase [Gammaproteobacteria bacterium]
MTDSSVQLITSRENALIARLRRLSQEPLAYRKQAEVWLEGDHLCRAALARGLRAPLAVVADTAWVGEHGQGQGSDERADLATRLARQAARVVVVPEALWKVFTGLESPARIGFLMPLVGEHVLTGAVQSGVATVVLDRLQDAGNVGSILRSAAALGVGQVLALKGTAGLWSPKVLRAGMGAHFGLNLVEQLSAEDLAGLGVPLVATSSHTENELHSVKLPEPCAWVMGHEGQGVSGELMARCTLSVRIPQPGGEESLNVAAATAICLYESLRRRVA